jgi:signal peptidase I
MNVANGDDLNKGFHLWPFVLAALVLALLGLLAGLYGIAVVDGGAMGATFAAGKWLLFAKKKQELHRGDLVAAKIDGKKLVRRIIGMPGETVTVEAGGRVLIKTAAVTTDGTVSGTTAGTAARTSAGTTAGTVALEEPYVVGTPNLLGLAQVQTVLDDDSYLLLADNRQHMVVTSGLRATPKGDIKGKIHTNKHHKFSI